MRRYEKDVIITSELGIYGKATIFFDKIIHLYGGAFENVRLKLMSPVKSSDGRTTIEYAIAVIYMVSSICV